jgi:hypothetical protein
MSASAGPSLDASRGVTWMILLGPQKVRTRVRNDPPTRESTRGIQAGRPDNDGADVRLGKIS